VRLYGESMDEPWQRSHDRGLTEGVYIGLTTESVDSLILIDRVRRSW
jgi:hypothetical protein